MQSAKSLMASIGLADVFPPQGIVVGLVAGTQQGAVEQLVHHLVALGHVPPAEEAAVVEGVMGREHNLGGMAFNGIACPHCRLRCVDKFVGAVGLDPRGLPFDAADGNPVYALFLVLAPLERRDQLYELLGRVAALGRDKTLRLQLRGCGSAEAVHYFLQSVDRQ